MRPLQSLVLAMTLILPIGAAPAAQTTGAETARLRAEIDSLQKANAELRAQLAKAQAEIARLRVHARVPGPYTFPPIRVPSVPRPRLRDGTQPDLHPLPLPPDARERGQGNTRHYVIPVAPDGIPQR